MFFSNGQVKKVTKKEEFKRPFHLFRPQTLPTSSSFSFPLISFLSCFREKPTKSNLLAKPPFFLAKAVLVLRHLVSLPCPLKGPFFRFSLSFPVLLWFLRHDSFWDSNLICKFFCLLSFLLSNVSHCCHLHSRF